VWRRLSLTRDEQNVPWLTQSLPRIRQPQVAAMGLTGAGSTVAVLDSGANFTLPAFGSCTSPGVPASCRVPVAFDAAPDDGSMDASSVLHGTNVSAIVAGVAPGARVIPIDVFDGAVAWDHDVVKGIDWVLHNRASYNIRAVNLSFGKPKSYHVQGCGDGGLWRNPYGQPFSFLRMAGVVPVVAAGNDATPGGTFRDGIAYPACTGAAFPVGATYSAASGSLVWGSGADACTDTAIVADRLTCFSQDGEQLALLAPGAMITAAGVTLGGTSQAAPHVAGAAAVLAQARPQSTAGDLEAYLRTSSTVLTDARTGRSHPRLDLLAALRAAVPVPNDPRSAARVLPGWGGQLTQTTWGATKEPGEPLHAGDTGGSSVWFRWTATQGGTLVLSTSGSDFDTLLAVYRETGTTLTPVAANDDAPAGAPAIRTSLVTVPVTNGDTLLVAVDGKKPAGAGTFPAAGHLQLTWNLPNDGIAGVLPLVAGVSVAGANIGATHEWGEPHHCGDTFSTASVWYRWTAPATGATVRIQAGGSRFLCVATYQSGVMAPTVGDLAPTAGAADDAGQPVDYTFLAAPGATYWVAVDGVSVETTCGSNGQCWYATPTGTFALTLTT
jgi:subtilisin family serine protease